MSQNAQNISFKDQNRQMVAKMMSERDAQRLYQQAMQELTAHLQGNLVFPGDSDYESARGIWNGAADCHPAMIVHPVNVADVITAVNFAREQGMEVAVRSGGHSIPGYSTIDNGMVMDLSRMKSITF